MNILAPQRAPALLALALLVLDACTRPTVTHTPQHHTGHAKARPDTAPRQITQDSISSYPSTPPGRASDQDSDWIEALPGVRVSRAMRAVMFDARVPIDVHDSTPLVFLEVLVCSRGTREHESLLVTDIPPSRVHAALLMLGLEPGTVGRWFFENNSLRSSPPTGPRVRVLARFTRDGTEVSEPLSCWAKNMTTNKHACDDESGWWVFAGSRFQRQPTGNVYAGDVEGTLVGLSTFGTETLAWTRMHHHESRHEEPVWIADTSRVPPRNTGVQVLLIAE